MAWREQSVPSVQVTPDRWQDQREQANEQTTEDLNTLWGHANLLRLRVAEDHRLLETFNRGTEQLGKATTVLAELLEHGVDRVQRRPIWDLFQEHRIGSVEAQGEFAAAARELLGPKLDRLSR